MPAGAAVPPAPVPPCRPLEVLSVIGPIHLCLRHHLTNISNWLFKEKQKRIHLKRELDIACTKAKLMSPDTHWKNTRHEP